MEKDNTCPFNVTQHLFIGNIICHDRLDILKKKKTFELISSCCSEFQSKREHAGETELRTVSFLVSGFYI